MSLGDLAIQVGKESRSGRGCGGTVPVRLQDVRAGGPIILNLAMPVMGIRRSGIRRFGP